MPRKASRTTPTSRLMRIRALPPHALSRRPCDTPPRRHLRLQHDPGYPRHLVQVQSSLQSARRSGRKYILELSGTFTNAAVVYECRRVAGHHTVRVEVIDSAVPRVRVAMGRAVKRATTPPSAPRDKQVGTGLQRDHGFGHRRGRPPFPPNGSGDPRTNRHFGQCRPLDPAHATAGATDPTEKANLRPTPPPRPRRS